MTEEIYAHVIAKRKNGNIGVGERIDVGVVHSMESERGKKQKKMRDRRLVIIKDEGTTTSSRKNGKEELIFGLPFGGIK